MIQKTLIDNKSNEDMKRRNFASTFLIGYLVFPGCIQVNTQPQHVPIRVKNQTDQSFVIDIQLSENGTDDMLVSTDLHLASEEEDSVYVEPIDEHGEYLLTINIEDNVQETSLSGGRIRDITVSILAVDDIQINTITT